MRPVGTSEELERRRRLAVRRVHEGYSTQEVADFLGIDPSSVRRWLSVFRQGGERALRARPVAGRPPKLSYTHEKIILRWLRSNPIEFGFPTELWSAKRLALMIRTAFEIDMSVHYLSNWMRERDFTPQIPGRIPRERNPERIAAWVSQDWPRIKKKRLLRGQTSHLPTKADS